MAKGPFRIRDAAGHALRQIALWTSADEADVDSSPRLLGVDGAPSSTPDAAVAVALQGDATRDDEVVHVTTDTGTTWKKLGDVIAGGPDQVVIWDDFLYQTLTEADTPWILNSGADAQAIDPAIAADSEGGVLLMTTGNVGDTFANDGTQIVCSIPVQADSGGLVVEARLHLNTDITDRAVFVGLTDVTTLEMPFTNAADTITAVADDGCGFLFDTDATTDEWWTVAVDSTTSDTGDATTGTAPVADTYQVFRIEVDSDGSVIRFYIDGTLEATFSGDAGVSPDVNLYFTICADSHTAGSKTVDVDYIRIAHGR